MILVVDSCTGVAGREPPQAGQDIVSERGHQVLGTTTTAALHESLVSIMLLLVYHLLLARTTMRKDSGQLFAGA